MSLVVLGIGIIVLGAYTFSILHSPSRGCPAACGGEEAKGDRAEALAPVLRSSLLRRMERRVLSFGAVPLGFTTNAPRLFTESFTLGMKSTRRTRHTKLFQSPVEDTPFVTAILNPLVNSPSS
jgi:hypothetical protein